MLGENVEEMFTRVAAVIFEDVIQSEIKTQQQEKKETIGQGNTLISKWYMRTYIATLLIFNF